MKILYVDLQYDYGVKSRGPNEIGERGFRQVFQNLGHEVECFYYDDYLKRLPDLQKALIDKAKETSPDLIYFILFEKQFDTETLDYLNKHYKTMNWFGDDQWRFDSFTKEYAPHFTYSVTTDPFAVTKYHDIGVKNVILSQWAALNYDIPSATNSEYQYDVSFVGSSHSVRRWFIKELEKKGIRVAKFGYGWPNGSLTLTQMTELFRNTKINLNLSNSITYDLRYLTNNIKNPIVAYVSPKAASQIKARNFEIPYFGGFQLTDYVPFIENYFSIGKEIACYRDFDEAALLIDYYLKNDEQRELIKNAGIARSRNEHSYFHRHKSVFEQMK